MKIERTGTYIGIGILGVMWLFPITAVAVTVVKNLQQFNTMDFWFVPSIKGILLNLVDNIRGAWTGGNLGDSFLNSLLYATSAGVGSAFLASLAGYALVHLPIRGRLGWFLLIFSGNLFPFQMFLIPLYVFLTSLGLYDTRISLIIIYIGICTPFALFVFRNYALTLPREVLEAARIDGYSPLGIYWSIFLPLSKAAFVVVFIFQYIWTWNDLLFGLVLSEKVRPIMTGLSKLAGFRAAVSVPQILMGGVIASLPPALILLVLQQYFIKGLSLRTTGE